MTGEFTKPGKVYPALVGQIADPDIYNQNIAAQSKGTIIPIDEDGEYADGDIGDETIGSAGALIENLKMRAGGFIKIYDAFGMFVQNITFGQATTTTLGSSFLPKIIEFSINVTDPNNDIDFSAGNFSFDDESGQAALSAITGQLDVVFGTGNGMLDAGSKANSTLYHLFAIYNPTTVTSKVLASTSPSSPTMPSGYTKKQRIGSILTDGSGNITSSYWCKRTSYGQFAYYKYSAVATGTTVMPLDDTIPTQSSPAEGDQYMSIPFAPLSVKSVLEIRSLANAAASGGDTICGALFQDSTQAALRATAEKLEHNVANVTHQIQLEHQMIAASLSNTTFKFRMGTGSSTTVTFNGASGNRYFGGIFGSGMIVKEYL